MTQRLPIAVCTKCHRLRVDGPGSHAARWVEREGRKTLVDCVGDVVGVGIPVPAVKP